jgi:hypothetical protein
MEETGRHWLHFVGRKYYKTPKAFAREAEGAGVTRRLSLQTLERMAWGDEVVLVQRSGKSTIVFGAFTLSTLTGLSAEAVHAIGRAGTLEQVADGGDLVERGCGSYVTGPTFAVGGLTLAEIAALLRECADPGKPMIGGEYREHVPVRLVSIDKHTQGFRRLDYETLLLRAAAAEQRLAEGGSKALPRVKGWLYEDDDTLPVRRAGVVQEVAIYKRLEELQRMRRSNQEALF